MDHGRHIDNHVLDSKVLVHFQELLSLLLFVFCVHDGINDGEHRVSHVVHYEGTDTAQHHVKALYRIALLVKVRRFRGKLLFEPGAYRRQKVLVAQVVEEVKVREVLLVDLLADFEP